MVESDTPADDFWRFALATYLPDASRAAFLRLQDRDGMDVPLLLFCLWRGGLGRRITPEAMRAAQEFSACWRSERVEPLRALRRDWKNDTGPDAALVEAARQEVARAEQALERLQMTRLAAFVGAEATAAPAVATSANVALYCDVAGITASASDIAIVSPN